MSTDTIKVIKEILFDLCKHEGTELLYIEKFFHELHMRGIQKNDPRVKAAFKAIEHDNEKEINKEKFMKILEEYSVEIIEKVFKREVAVPDFESFTQEITKIYWKVKQNRSGKNASYLPELSRVDANLFGVSICTVDGQRFSIGDSNIRFPIDSCCKPLMYAVALEELTSTVVHQYVGNEPRGKVTNEHIFNHNQQPHNPLINAGAILTASLLVTLVHDELSFLEKFNYVHSYFESMAGDGESFGFNNSVFFSEREAADRNYALGFFMREHKVFPEKSNLRECIDFYFQICAMESTADSMSVVAATLANGGVCPLTNKKVLSNETVRDVLSMMQSCGMNDYSGQFAFNIGLPAKSGTAGGMMVIIPGVTGIFTYSPPLDEYGNSVRGVQFVEDLLKVFCFRPFDNLKHSMKKNATSHLSCGV